MARPQRAGRAILRVIVLGLLLSPLACRGSLGPPPATGSAGEVATLQQQVAGQATRIAALEVKVAALQPVAAAQGTRIVALETKVAGPQSAAAQAQPTASGPTPTFAPTPTIVPPVAGLVESGDTKGLATAKVTITEYTDYL